MNTMQRQNVFILGTAYSGSTMLGKALSKHSQIGYIGELSRARGFYKKYQLDNEAGECLECVLQGQKCAVLTKEFVASTAKYTPLMAQNKLADTIGEPIIVDGSKHVEWLRIATQNNKSNAKIKAIILARNPVDYIQSCKDRGIGPIWAEANAWRDTYYDALRTVSQLNIPFIVIQFEQLLAEPQSTLEQICRLLGVSFEDTMLSRTSPPLHAIGGNPSAYKTSANRSVLTRLHKRLGQRLFDINPQSLKNVSKKPKKIDAEVAGATFMTPGLVDIANLIGYRRSHLFPHK